MKKRAIGLAVCIVFMASLVSAIGVTSPHPQNIQLKEGESSSFNFQIQTDDIALTCVPIVEETGGLELAFNQEYIVGENERFIVQPKVLVPEGTPVGDYEASFCIECSPSGDVEGNRIIPTICKLPLSVNVVSERTRANMFDEEGISSGTIVLLLSIAIIILAVIIFFLLKRRASNAEAMVETKK